MTANGVHQSVRLLLERSLDYAGLFPPASLSMDQAARNYAAYRAGPHEWMLGRFVVPAARVDALEAAAADHAFEDAPWPVSVLLSEPAEAEVAGRRLRVSAVEVRTAQAQDIARAAEKVGPAGIPIYCEVPLDADPREFADAAADAGVLLKARTGGVTEDAFPAAEQLTAFMRACVERNVAFKLTAGLHHAVRGEYRLTYERGSPCGMMFGFLNAFLAAALCVTGAHGDNVLAVLTESAAGAIAFNEEGVHWRGAHLSLDHIRRTRALLHAFGSCSFEEPVQELTAMGLLQ